MDSCQRCAAASKQKDLEQQRVNIIAKREAVNRGEIDALRVRAVHLEAELKRVSNPLASNSSVRYPFSIQWIKIAIGVANEAYSYVCIRHGKIAKQTYTVPAIVSKTRIIKKFLILLKGK